MFDILCISPLYSHIYHYMLVFILMADNGVFATTAEVQRKAGANASSTSNVEAYINDYMTQVESYNNSFCRYNFSDNYSTLNADVKGLLKEVASNLAAIYVIEYDFSGFTSRLEAESMIRTLHRRAGEGLAILRDKKTQEYMKNA